MNYKFIHLSLALLTLAPSLYAADETTKEKGGNSARELRSRLEKETDPKRQGVIGRVLAALEAKPEAAAQAAVVPATEAAETPTAIELEKAAAEVAATPETAFQKFRKERSDALGQKLNYKELFPKKTHTQEELDQRLSEAEKRRAQILAQRVATAQREKKRTTQKNRFNNILALGLKTPVGTDSAEGLSPYKRMQLIATLTGNRMERELADWESSLLNFTSLPCSELEVIVANLLKITGSTNSNLASRLALLEKNSTTCQALLALHNLPQPPIEGSKKEYHQSLQALRASTRDLPTEFKNTRTPLLNIITNEQKHHGMPAETWGDTLAALNPFATK